MTFSLLDSWNKTQDNGDIIYTKYPMLNLSTDGRDEVRKFKRFCDFNGVVLDVGCGLETPAYLKDNKEITLGIGVDPLLKKQSHYNNIQLIKSVGETLSFKEKTFDFISFATSFDHVIDPDITLKEIIRILKDTGISIFWVESEHVKRASIMKRVSRKIFAKETDPFISKAIQEQNIIVDEMVCPEGSIDKFHLRHIRHLAFIELAATKGLIKIKEEDHPEFNSVFLKLYNL